jgi:DNA-binding transcriptional regulator YiaG
LEVPFVTTLGTQSQRFEKDALLQINKRIKALGAFLAFCHIRFMTKEDFNKLREGAAYTQASLAAAMGVHLRTVWRWELGQNTDAANLSEAGLAP